MSTGLTTSKASTLEKVLEGMSAEVREARDAIAGILRAGEAGMLLQAWDLGNWVKTVKTNPDQYGENSVEQIAHSLQLEGFATAKATRLYDAMGLVLCWPKREQMEAFAEEGKLTVQHLTEVKRLENAKDRNKYLKLASDKNLSATQLRSEIQAGDSARNRKNTKRDGRPPRKPASTIAGVKQMQAFMTKSRNLDKAIWNGYVLKRLSSMADSSVNDKLVIELEQLINVMEAASTEMRTTLDLVRKQRSRFEKIMASKSTEAAVETTPGKGARPSKTTKKANAAA